MGNLEDFNKKLEAQLKRLDFDIAAVRVAEESGLHVVLLDPLAKTKVNPSAVKIVQFAVHGVDGTCEWQSLAYIWKPGRLVLVNFKTHIEEEIDINRYYKREFMNIIYLYPCLEQASLTKVPRAGNRGAEYVYLYVYIMGDHSLNIVGGASWPPDYPKPVHDEDKIRKRILELESSPT